MFAPQIGTEFGGSGLNMRDRLPIVEASGYSRFGPLALNCAAPDDGNIFLLEQLASAAQQDRYLIPLAAGRIRSCYVSTESAVVARVGRTGLPTMAERTGAGWVINGRSRFVRGAVGASVAIVTAHTSAGGGSRGGTTMFVVDADTPGYTLRAMSIPIGHGRSVATASWCSRISRSARTRCSARWTVPSTMPWPGSDR